MQLLPAETHTPRRIAALHFIEDIPGHCLPHIGAAEALDQVDVQIARRDRAAGAIQVIGVGQVLFLIEQHFREALGEVIEEAPVSGRLLAVEQPGFGQPEYATGLTAQYCASCVLFTQPGQDLWVALAQGVEIVDEGGQDDDVGVVEGAVNRQYDFTEAAHRFPVRAHQSRFESGFQAMPQLFAVAQAGQMEEILGLGEGGSEDSVDRENADAPQRYGVLSRHNLLFLYGKVVKQRRDRLIFCLMCPVSSSIGSAYALRALCPTIPPAQGVPCSQEHSSAPSTSFSATASASFSSSRQRRFMRSGRSRGISTARSGTAQASRACCARTCPKNMAAWRRIFSIPRWSSKRSTGWA